MKLQTHFFQNKLFICCDILFTFLVFKIGLVILVAQSVCIFRENLWKVVVKCGIVIFYCFEIIGFSSKCTFLRFQHFILPSTYPINSFFSVVVCIFKIHVFDEAFSVLTIIAMITEKITFSYFHSNFIREKSLHKIMQIINSDYPWKKMKSDR